MDIKDIITENEYTRVRSTKELFEWMNIKNKELSEWHPKRLDTEQYRTIRYREYGKGLPYKLTHELIPFAYYAKIYYGNKANTRFKPCCGSEPYDGIIIKDGKENPVEITNAIDGHTWALQKELLIAQGYSPWEYNIRGVRENKTKRKRCIRDIIVSEDPVSESEVINKTKKLIKEAVLAKCNRSLEQKLPYGQKKTILIVTFDDTGIGPGFSRKRWDDFIFFKKHDIDSIKHNFKKIVLFGWLDKEFID